ncbi:putative acyl-CoA dehydrogenase [Lentibacillus populi]|uniref:Acyl-CoA dehydrogenase n=1 Tax=Lentibacillus populi TaxID=1827502 RepID=A0A9W5TWK9_9BACI|nr:acyl-CoA dehydrogenase family protein [Lentibacillus populi]GGB37392.1 putative acyl-CoA dehydrogenase [Lentibacillus populi]
MIAFQPTEDESAFIDVAASFAADKLRPAARTCEENKKVEATLFQEAAELGFLSLELTENWDGLELPLISQTQILKALSYGDLGIIQGFSGAGDAASFIRLALDNPLLSIYKTNLTNGHTVALIDIEEGWRGSLTVTNNRLNGTSKPVRLAKDAQYVMVTAMNSAEEPIIVWLDKDLGNWYVEEGDYRLGLLASRIARLQFDNVAFAENNVIARGEKAAELIKQAWTRIRILQAAKEVGLMEAALDYATEYTAGRKAFGQEIAKFQGVSFRIATMAMETRLANHLVWQAALAADEGDQAAAGYSLRALHRAHRSLRYVTDSAVQMLGGHGFVQDFPVEKWMRGAQAQVSLL